MANLLLNNETLVNFLEELNIDREKKEIILSKIPEMDFEERKRLFNTLKDVYLLDIEEKEAIGKVKKFWKE